MRKHVAVFLLAAFAAFVAHARAVTIDWTPVGNPGNANDPATGSLYGAVGYSYSIGTYDVTNSQYVEFLNAKNPTGANVLGLYNSNMSSAPFGGINFNSLASPGSKYSVIPGDGQHPVNFVTWYDTIRFANWLNNGQGNGDTETGAYTLGALGAGGVPINGNSITRNPGATIVLPNENEWYKAAYYDPRSTAQGGPPSNSHYWLYPTSSNTTPTATGPTATPNSANYYPFGPDNPTDVGAYTGTTSPYGAFDMGGDVFQWNETLTFAASFRGKRGGSFFDGSIYLLSSQRLNAIPTLGNIDIGFRLAEIPEPSTGVLAVIAFVGLFGWGWRRRRR